MSLRVEAQALLVLSRNLQPYFHFTLTHEWPVMKMQGIKLAS